MLRDLGFDMYAWPFTDGKTARSSNASEQKEVIWESILEPKPI